jgi:hypothetical protein
VAQAAARVRDGEGDLTFEPWVLDIAGKYLFIWPWHIVEPEAITEAKTYVATLQSASSGALSIQLKMAMGQERILAPSSTLVAAAGLAKALPGPERMRLARVLLAINRHYSSSKSIRIGSESTALATAMHELELA